MRYFSWLLSCLLLTKAAKKGKTTTRANENQYVSPLRHEISVVTPRNFELSISKARDRFPAAVLYYRRTSAAKDFIDNKWDVIAKQVKGMLKIGAVDCDEYATFCSQQDLADIDQFAIRIYPVLPLPPHVWQVMANEEASKIINKLITLVPDARISNITDEQSLSDFVGKFPTLPKVILFTEKSRVSRIYHALGNSFSDRMLFGVFKGKVGDRIAKRFKITKFPSILLKRGDLTSTARGTYIYQGVFNFTEIHQWLNVHAETFVKGGGFLTDTEPNSYNLTNLRPWLTQSIPELTKASHNDVCFKKAKGLCVTYLKWDDQLSPDELQMLEDLAKEFQATQRPELHWSWMNLEIETNYKELFGMIETKQPSLVVFNPHSRLRYSKLPSQVVANAETIQAFINKIISGDGRFTIIKGNKVPAFTVRAKKRNIDEGPISKKHDQEL